MASLCKLEDFASTFAPYIDELRDFFASRDVPFGSAEDVAIVVERLSGDGAFRDEMASMLRAIIYRERDGLAPIELFELVVLAIGGPRVEETGEEIHGSVQLLAFVRGVCHSRWKTDADASPAKSEESPRGWEPATMQAPEPPRATSDVETARSGAKPAEIIREARTNSETHTNSALFYRARVVAAKRHEPEWPAETRAPMEQPAPQAEAQRAEVGAEVETPVLCVAAPVEAAPVTARQPFVNWSTLKLPTVNWSAFTWPGLTLPAARWPTVSWPTMSLRWLKRVAVGQRRWIWVAGLCALVLAAAVALWLHNGATPVANPVATSGRRAEPSTGSGLAAARKPSPAVKNLREDDVAALISAAVQRGRSMGEGEDAESAPDASLESPLPQAEVDEGQVGRSRPQPVRQQQAEVPLASEPSAQPAQSAPASMVAAAAPQPQAHDNTFAASASRAGVARYGVSPALMQRRLLYSPRLQYPALAKLAHVQGKVVVEAVVGREGSVIAATVLSGHRLLRGAALSAVRERRYRPYTVNDRPMEVATIVTVNFRLHR